MTKNTNTFGFIPYGKQLIEEEDIQSVVDVLKSDWITQGPKIKEFEEKIAEYCNAKYAVATCNATAALHLSYLSLNLNQNDILWTSPISFVATSNAALYCQAKVDFIDINPKTYNICIDKLKTKLDQAKKSNTLPKIIVPVHLAGQSCEMTELTNLSEEYGFKIVEDASHAIGGSYKQSKIGSCQYSDLCVFSFHPVKIITTGEGGIITTNNKDLYEKILRLRTHGIVKDSTIMKNEPDGNWYYEQIDLGYNYRITDIQAALGISQLKKLDNFISKRHAIANKYNESLKDLPLILPYNDPECFSSYHLYIIRLQTEKINKSHKQVFEGLNKAGIGINLHYIPIYKHPYYEQFNYNKDEFVEAEKYYTEAISLPIFPHLKEEEQIYVIDKLKEILL